MAAPAAWELPTCNALVYGCTAPGVSAQPSASEVGAGDGWSPPWLPGSREVRDRRVGAVLLRLALPWSCLSIPASRPPEPSSGPQA